YNGVSGNGTDLIGFNLLPAGQIQIENGFRHEAGAGSDSFLYTSTGDGIMVARSFWSGVKGINRIGFLGFVSIRCVKD
ncbi:fibrobacter succinogenes major paralogous domain-containing protein, partial [Williamwhitmania taraxaci]